MQDQEQNHSDLRTAEYSALRQEPNSKQGHAIQIFVATAGAIATAAGFVASQLVSALAAAAAKAADPDVTKPVAPSAETLCLTALWGLAGALLLLCVSVITVRCLYQAIAVIAAYIAVYHEGGEPSWEGWETTLTKLRRPNNETEQKPHGKLRYWLTWTLTKLRRSNGEAGNDKRSKPNSRTEQKPRGKLWYWPTWKGLAFGYGVTLAALVVVGWMTARCWPESSKSVVTQQWPFIVSVVLSAITAWFVMLLGKTDSFRDGVLKRLAALDRK